MCLLHLYLLGDFSREMSCLAKEEGEAKEANIKAVLTSVCQCAILSLFNTQPCNKMNQHRNDIESKFVPSYLLAAASISC